LQPFNDDRCLIECTENDGHGRRFAVNHRLGGRQRGVGAR
jgi:hypothetical protein